MPLVWSPVPAHRDPAPSRGVLAQEWARDRSCRHGRGRIRLLPNRRPRRWRREQGLQFRHDSLDRECRSPPPANAEPASVESGCGASSGCSPASPGSAKLPARCGPEARRRSRTVEWLRSAATLAAFLARDGVSGGTLPTERILSTAMRFTLPTCSRPLPRSHCRCDPAPPRHGRACRRWRLGRAPHYRNCCRVSENFTQPQVLFC